MSNFFFLGDEEAGYTEVFFMELRSAFSKEWKYVKLEAVFQ